MLRPNRARPAVGDLGALKERLRDLGPIVVAFSGGADSAFLAWMANSVLGHHGALAVTAVSASLAPSELADCRSLAARVGPQLRRGGHPRRRSARVQGQWGRPVLALQR